MVLGVFDHGSDSWFGQRPDPPDFEVLSCGFIIITLGLFVFVINAATFMLSANISQSLGFHFAVDSFGTALLASIIVSFVSVVLSSILIDEDKR